MHYTRQFVEVPTGRRSRRALYDEDRTHTQTTDITIQRRVKYTIRIVHLTSSMWILIGLHRYYVFE